MKGEKEKHLIHSSSVKDKQEKLYQLLKDTDVNNLKAEGPVKSPHEKADQGRKAVAGCGQLAPAGSAAQPS